MFRKNNPNVHSQPTSAAIATQLHTLLTSLYQREILNFNLSSLFREYISTYLQIT